MHPFPPVDELSSRDFEICVRDWLEEAAGPLDAFEATHVSTLSASDGDYEIDFVVRFSALAGAAFLVIVECKKHKHPIKREVVLSLHSKQASLGANKALLFSTTPFQSGAIEFARSHGIGLVQVVSGDVRFIQASAKRRPEPIPSDAEPFVGIFHSPKAGVAPELVARDLCFGLAAYLSTQSACDVAP